MSFMVVSPIANPDSDPAMQAEYRRMADKIRSGEYFEESREMYDVMVHDLMSERYMYIFITIVAAFIFLISYAAKESLYPLNNAVPYVFHPTDPLEDMPHMKSLQSYKGEDPGEGVLRYMIQNYIKLRETYSVERFDLFVEGVRNQSAPAVMAEFQAMVDPRNALSPVVQYQRHSKREVSVLSYRRQGLDSMEVEYEATVTGRGEIRRSRWKANIAFQYSGVTLNDEGKVNPLSFTVTEYQTKRIQDVQ